MSTVALILGVVLAIAAFGVLVWRAVADRNDIRHLTHLLVARNPAEARFLDRPTRDKPAVDPDEEEHALGLNVGWEQAGLRVGT